MILNLSCFEIPTILSTRNCRLVIPTVCGAATCFSFCTVGSTGLWAPNQNQVANGYRLEDHEEMGTLLIRTQGDRASRLLAVWA